MKPTTPLINLCFIPLICVLPLFGSLACSVVEASDIAADGVEAIGNGLSELPDNLREAGPYLQEDLEILWQEISDGIDTYAEEFGVQEPHHPLTRCREVRERLIAGESFNEVIRNAMNELTRDDLENMPISDLNALNRVLPFEVDLAECSGNLADVLNSLDIGQVSAVLRSEAGYHLIQLLDREGGQVKIGHVVFAITPAIEDEPEPEEEEAPDSLLEAISKLSEAVNSQ